MCSAKRRAQQRSALDLVHQPPSAECQQAGDVTTLQEVKRVISRWNDVRRGKGGIKALEVAHHLILKGYDRFDFARIGNFEHKLRASGRMEMKVLIALAGEQTSLGLNSVVLPRDRLRFRERKTRRRRLQYAIHALSIAAIGCNRAHHKRNQTRTQFIDAKAAVMMIPSWQPVHRAEYKHRGHFRVRAIKTTVATALL